MAARRAERGSGGTVKVTWARSTIGHTAATRGTIRALGLHRLHQTVEVADTPETRGMLRRVAFLLDVEEPSGTAAGDARGTTTTNEEEAK